jgi:RNA polymerase sigma factor (sigma-70 family)
VDELERRTRLEALFAEHAAAVRAYALRRIGAEAADDTVSEVFVVACRRLEHVPTDALPWLLACARRVLANQRRGARRRDALLERLHGETSPAWAEWEAGGRPLLAALAGLRERDREVLLLVAWEGLEPARAAAALECSLPAFTVRLHRARRRLAAALERAEQADSPPPRPTEAIR